MKITSKWFILFCVLWASVVSISTFAETQPKQSYNLTVSSPIYRSTTENVSLDVTVPHEFKPVQTAAQAAMLRLLQFIPKNEDPKTWSQMIVLQILGDQKINAAQFTQLISEKVKSKLGNIQVLIKNTQTEKEYLISSLGIYYESGSRREISFMNYYSSAGHLSGCSIFGCSRKMRNPRL